MLTIKSAPTRLFALVISLLSINAQADIANNLTAFGALTASGVLNVTFHKKGLEPIKTVATSNETWVFNADHSFTRGDLSGTWTPKNQTLAVAKYNRQAYKQRLAAFWNSLGVVVSDVRIEENKLMIRDVSNGLSIEETVIYRVKVAEKGGNVPAKISIQGSFVVASDGAENQALLDAFSIMQDSEQAGTSVTTGGVWSISNGGFIVNLGPIAADPATSNPADNQAPPTP